MSSLYLAGLTVGLSAQAATFNVKNYGAKGDGSAVDTTAINNAITAANGAGGGIVEFPSGKYKTGSVHLKSNVTLQLDSGSTILANSSGIDNAESNPNSSYQDYGHSHFHDALIWGDGLTNIGITGPGTIDGNGNLKTSQPSSGQGDKALCLRECDTVTLSDFTIKNGGWFAILTNGTNHMTVTNIKILDKSERDAFDLINAQHVHITGSDIEGSDDSMCLKADYALGRKILNTDIVVDHCTILSAGNNAVQFGSETVGDFSDVHFSNLTITSAGKAGLGMTSNDGSIMDGVTFDTITMTGCVTPIWLKITNNHRAPGSPPPGRIRNVTFTDITSSKQPSGAITSAIQGCGTVSPAIPIENVTFNNVKLIVPGGQSANSNTPPETNQWQPRYLGTAPSYGWYIRHATGITFNGCSVEFDSNDNRPAVIVNDGKSIDLDGFVAERGSSSAYDLGFTNVAGYSAAGAVSTTGSALRINAVNSTPSGGGGSVAAPTVSPAGGTYSSAQSVTLTTATSGATIRYTTDGSTPSPTVGTVYTAPFTTVTSGSETINAIAYTSSASSSVTTVTYTISTGGGTTQKWEAESLTRTTSGASASTDTDSAASGGARVTLAADSVGDYVEFTTPSVPAGTYQIKMAYKTNNNRGILNFKVDGTQLGGTLDQYASSASYPEFAFGTTTFSSAGTHKLRLTVTGKNSSSSSYTLSADTFTLVAQ